MGLSYSNAIIFGLKKIGFDSRRLRESARISASRIESVIADRSEFTDKELDLIERSSGRTAGQLAALAIEPNGGRLTGIMDQWAKVAKLESAVKRKKAAVSKIP